MFESIAAAFAYIVSRFSPEIIAAFITALFSYLVPVVLKVVSVLGVSSVTMIGINALAGVLSDHVEGYFNGFPADVLAIVGIMKLDIGFSLISSAMLVKWTLKGWDKANDSVSSTSMKIPTPSDGGGDSA